MLSHIKEACDVEIILADNGRAWTDAEPEGVSALRAIAEFANNNCHKAIYSELKDFVNNIRGDN